MKKLTLLLILGLLSACSVKESETAEESALSLIATTSMLADLAEEVGGEHVSVTGLMGPGVDPHDYQPTTSDVIKMGEAEVVLYNGLTLEERFVQVFEHLGQRGVHTIVAGDSLDASLTDPHIWFSVPYWQEVTKHLAHELSEEDPKNAESYHENAKGFIQELEELDTYIRDRIEEVPENARYLVTAHDAFQYFGEEYGFEVVGLQGLNTQTEAGTGDISQLADFLVTQDIQAVFVESSVSPRNIEALIEAAASRGHNVKNAGELYSDALGSEAAGTDTYIHMYRANIDTIVDALAH